MHSKIKLIGSYLYHSIKLRVLKRIKQHHKKKIRKKEEKIMLAFEKQIRAEAALLSQYGRVGAATLRNVILNTGNRYGSSLLIDHVDVKVDIKEVPGKVLDMGPHALRVAVLYRLHDRREKRYLYIQG